MQSRYALVEFQRPVDVGEPAEKALVNELKITFLPPEVQEMLTSADYAVDVVNARSVDEFLDATVGCALRIGVAAVAHALSLSVIVPLVGWIDDVLAGEKAVTWHDTPFTVTHGGCTWTVTSLEGLTSLESAKLLGEILRGHADGFDGAELAVDEVTAMDGRRWPHQPPARHGVSATG
ncbi:hypothetical protein ACRYCC_15535 [Actinomadura scrupuli]|uniref:hypothetical protein n=1 Tax=Actinomadura scrupuli TaxID=559629 RepID=UPI003D97EEBA